MYDEEDSIVDGELHAFKQLSYKREADYQIKQIMLEQRVKNLEDSWEAYAIELQFTFDQKVSKGIDSLNQMFNNRQAYLDQRLLELEQKYDAIDPKYLAQGESLSKTNKYMIDRLLQIEEQAHARMNLLHARLLILEGKRK